MKIQPVAITNIEWRSFTDFVQSVTGESPTRGLDAKHIPLKSAFAHIAALNMSNDPNTLKTDPRIRDHYFITIGITDVKQSFVLRLASSILTYISEYDDEYLCLVTASFNGWIEYILKYSTRQSMKQERELANLMYRLFTKEFYNFCEDKRIQDLPDGTFILC